MAVIGNIGGVAEEDGLGGDRLEDEADIEEESRTGSDEQLIQNITIRPEVIVSIDVMSQLGGHDLC